MAQSRLRRDHQSRVSRAGSKAISQQEGQQSQCRHDRNDSGDDALSSTNQRSLSLLYLPIADYRERQPNWSREATDERTKCGPQRPMADRWSLGTRRRCTTRKVANVAVDPRMRATAPVVPVRPPTRSGRSWRVWYLGLT